MTLRAVFDCMVFLQGAARPAGPARACLRLAEAGKVTLCISASILAEVRDVLTRPKTQARFPLLTPAWVEELLQGIVGKSLAIQHVPAAFALERDPKDEPYINLAIAAAAKFLVTRDKDLLNLMSDSDFCQRYPALSILDPVAFLKAVASDEAEGSP